MHSFTGFAFVLLISSVAAHSYLTNPISRTNQKQTNAGCRPPSCSVCDGSSTQASANPTTITRGSPIKVQWPRNNHPGGFVRIAWALTSSSDSAAAFNQGAQQYSCFETGSATCSPNANAPNDGDNAQATQTGCELNILAPNWLTDGRWTMQWSWFGGGYQLADYYGCVDYQVSGGPTGIQGQPTFTGGDYANPNDQTVCKYFNTQVLGTCSAEPCPGGNGAPRTGAPTNVQVVLTSTGEEDGEEDEDEVITCTSHADCPSGVCQVDGTCFRDSGSSGLGAGGIAALVFAFIFLGMVVAAIGFAYVNKSEWANWKLGPIKMRV